MVILTVYELKFKKDFLVFRHDFEYKTIDFYEILTQVSIPKKKPSEYLVFYGTNLWEERGQNYTFF